MSMMNLSLHWNDAPLKRIVVDSWEDASRVFCTDRDRGAYGASQMRGNCGVITRNRNVVGHVSYNGRVWDCKPQKWTPQSKVLFEPPHLTGAFPAAMVPLDILEWLLEYAFEEREQYLKVGSPEKDYDGKELIEFSSAQAEHCRDVAKLTKSLNMGGRAARWEALAHRFLSAGGL